MSLQNFIPTVYSGHLLANLRTQLIYAALCNNDYEGEIQGQGDTVKINGIGRITVSTYTKDTDISSPQSLTGAQEMLIINQADYFNFAIDDVDAAMQKPKVMTEAMSWSAYELALKTDQFVAGFYTDAANLIGTSGSPVVPAIGIDSNTGTTMYDYLVHLGTLLKQNNVPLSGSWAVVAPWMTEMLLQSVRFTSFNTPGARQTIIDGKLDASDGQIAPDMYVGRIRGMDIYESNNAPHIGGAVGAAGSQDVVLAGHSMSITYADAISKTEAYRPPTRFSDAVKGLHLYGAKVVRPAALAAGFFQHP